MICEVCGFNNNETDAFCSGCGAPLNNSQPVGEPAAQAFQPQYQQPYAQQYQQPDGQQFQQPYQQPFYPPYQVPQEDVSETVSLKEWLLSFLILCIPIANIVMAFVWAFSSKTKKSKSNYFKAYLILMLIAYILSFVLMFVIVFAFGMETSESLVESSSGWY